ncbi:TolC family outer membrane protein [Telmatospirillum sp.]|uniref:TolC family outer membrane protein n=1 Tax=Telmatospirillum sp. TaxID=2079197 RepID=UPI002850DF05|nr:TolC family outer membrane protein [Telmatospirillum sp.]MDR3438228.1 TolC family outer membrane protein [Telmatospirillum sp.]
MQKNTCLTVGLILAGCGYSGAVNAETLMEALASAYTSNPTLESQRAHLRAVDEQVPQALANWRPTVKLAGSLTRTNTYAKAPTSTVYGTEVLASDTRASSKAASLTVDQPLYRGGRTVAQIKQAEAQVAAARAQLANTEETVLVNVVSAYMNVVQYRAVRELSINDEQVLQRQLDATNDRFRVGEVTRTDVSQAESRLSAAHADRTQAEGNLRAAEANYVNVVGHAPDGLVSPGPVPGLPTSIDQAREMALAENPSVVSSQHSYRAAQHGIDLVAGELQPTVSLDGQVTRNYDYDGPKTYERIYQAGLNVTVPLYQQGQEYARLRAQKQTAGQARTDVDVARRDTIESVTKAWEALETARARISSYSDQIRSAQVALDGVQRESQVGSRTVLDVLNAEQELLNARVNLVEAQHDEAVAAYQLKSTIGQMTAQALALPVQVYDPVKHYDEVRDKWVGTGEVPADGHE